MKTLNKSDINLVRPKFRKMVELAWECGEDVPYGIVYLDDSPLTEDDIRWATKIVKEHNIKD